MLGTTPYEHCLKYKTVILCRYSLTNEVQLVTRRTSESFKALLESSGTNPSFETFGTRQSSTGGSPQPAFRSATATPGTFFTCRDQ